MGKRLGIDLGSTYSCSACIDDIGILRIIESTECTPYIPSSVFFNPNTKEFVVGEEAEKEGILNPEYLIRCIKNHLSDPTYEIFFGEDRYTPETIIYSILQKLISDAEIFWNEEIEGVVLSCPIYWSDATRQRLINVAKRVITSSNKHLNVIGVITDAEAISIAYRYYFCKDVQKNILIYDLGGGTFDTAVVTINAEQESRNIKILARDAAWFMGGLNWNHALESYVLDEYCNLTGADKFEVWNDPDLPWLFEKIEGAKRHLFVRGRTNITHSFNGCKKTITVTREAFEAETEHFLNLTFQVVTEMIKKANLSIENDIDEIVLVGGASRMPQVKRMLQEKYNKPIVLFEPDFAVAKGAAIVANDFKFM